MVKFKVRSDYQKLIKNMEKYLDHTTKIQKAIAEVTIAGVLKRTNSGRDVNMRVFKQYSKQYAKKKGRRSPVDLRNTGKLYHSFKYQIKGNLIRVYVQGDRAKIGFYHNAGRGHLPQRQWFGLDRKLLSVIKRLHLNYFKHIIYGR